MTEFRIPQVDLDVELFVRRNIFLARFAILSSLAHNELMQRTDILERVNPERFSRKFERFLYEHMIDMIHNQGNVDIDQLRSKIPSFAPNAPEFTKGCFANFEQIIHLRPTSKQVRQALSIVTSPPPKASFLESMRDNH